MSSKLETKTTGAMKPKTKKKGEKQVKRKSTKAAEEKLDMEEIDDRILSLKESLEELKLSKNYVL